MGALYAIFAGPDAGSPAGERAAAEDAARLDASLRGQGFRAGRRVALPGLILGAHAPFCGGDPMLLETPDGDALAAAGTLIHRGATGMEALRRLHADLRAGTLTDGDEPWGCFAVAGRVASRRVLRTDGAGTFHLHADGAGRIVSSSFLALAETLPRLSIDPQGVYDHVFQEAPHGGGTVFREIRLLSAGDGAALLPCPSGRRASLDEAAERCLAVLHRRFAVLAELWGGKLDAALSGGYDSRLILALLRRCGAVPALHVYGAADSPDVRIARAICAAEGLALETVDKAAAGTPDPEAFAAQVEANFLALDGCPIDGLFDNGMDVRTRTARSAGGRLALNGGGGEVFRDFFHLPPWGVSPAGLARRFYGGFDPSIAAGDFDADAYLDGLAGRIAATLGVEPDRRLSAVQAEALYPAFRCRWWMGRNASLNNRFGPALTPFVDPPVLRAALASPPALKRGGRLQARMIALADPALAAHPSAYGHAFDRPPPVAARAADLLLRLRPGWLPRRRRAGPLPALLTGPHREAVLPGRSEWVERFFRVERIGDPRQLARVLTLEYLFRRTRPAA
ncbi:hypothetical protein [Rhodocista pekingensis]|uniref:Asparagine synthetase domain-containing protein n=1 Tax=Rhodocista pekingensis TaxID=201185 RepID=A0ABW2KZ27_9PROT